MHLSTSREYRRAKRVLSATALKTLALAAAVGLAGCSQLPSAPNRPKISARKAAAAIALFDSNKDGGIDSDEISAPTCPLRVMAKRLDKNHDGSVTADEIAAHIREWQSARSVLMAISPTFYLEGEPLVDATITLEPVEFLGSSYPTYTTTTNQKGEAHFAGDDRRYPGVYLGLYRIRVSKQENGQEIIAKEYNVDSPFAIEVAFDTFFASTFRSFGVSKKREQRPGPRKR